MARQFQDRVQVLGIGSKDSPAALESFVSKHGLGGFPHAADADGSLRSRLGVVGQPTWIFVDPDGGTEKVFGELGAKGLEDRIERLLGT